MDWEKEECSTGLICRDDIPLQAWTTNIIIHLPASYSTWKATHGRFSNSTYLIYPDSSTLDAATDNAGQQHTLNLYMLIPIFI